MIRSPSLSTLRNRCKTIKKVVQQRLFANISGVIGDGRDNLKHDDDRKDFFNTLFEDDELQNSMAYSLAMASLEGSEFPSLSRSLNDREKEQLRISKIQRRHFQSNTTLAVSASKEQRTNNTNAGQRRKDRETFFRAISEDREIHNSMAYSLSMAMDTEESDFLPFTRSIKSAKKKKQPIVTEEQIRHDRMIATQQIYEGNKIDDDTLSTDMDIYDDNDDTLSMSFTSSFPPLTRDLNRRESNQLLISKDQLLSKCATYPEQRRQKYPLPRTLQDALRPTSEAIVITENKMPFRVFDVNDAWVGLCGYSFVESKGKSLGELLGGEETDACAVTALIHQLYVHGEEATTVLTNYTKDGRKFRNRLSVGPLYDDETNKVTHFVGVLKEVSVGG